MMGRMGKAAADEDSVGEAVGKGCGVQGLQGELGQEEVQNGGHGMTASQSDE